MRKKKIMAVLCIMAIGIGGCQKTPDTSIVKNKNMDKLISAARKDQDDVSNLLDIKEYEDYKTTIEDSKLGVTIHADAKVAIPNVEKLSMFRVEQKPIQQEFLEKVRKVLLKDQKIYDGSITHQRTKDVIEEEIATLKREIADYEGEAQDKKEHEKEVQKEINRLKKEYEKAPKSMQFQGNESDGMIRKVKELLKKDPKNDFYMWENDLNPDGDVYYGITDGNDGNYASLFVQNNPEYGNCLRYYVGKHGYEFLESAIVGGDEFGYLDEEQLEGRKEFTDEGTTISIEEAKEKADDLITQLGFSEFRFYEGEMREEGADIRRELEGLETKGYRKLYVLRYMRNVKDVFVTYESVGKYSESFVGENVKKMHWPVETIEIRVNDNGIAGFFFEAPTKITETVVENASLKSFDEIKGIFEKMVAIANASQADDEPMKTKITVDQVVLGYTRISEKDSFHTGLLVPVWDFIGTVEVTDGKETGIEKKSILTINAIDGSVINRTLGY